MRYAIIENGIVVNVAVARFPLFENWIPDEEGKAHIGGAWDGEQFHLPVPDPEKTAADVRAERDRLLAESDVYVLPDRWEAYTAEQRSAWSAYRQALRDIPEQAGFPFDISWPTKPE